MPRVARRMLPLGTMAPPFDTGTTATGGERPLGRAIPRVQGRWQRDLGTMRAPAGNVTAATLMAVATTINTEGPTYTCATGTFDPGALAIKYPNQRRQKTITINGVSFSADLIEQSATNLLAAGTSERFGVTWTVGTGSPTVTDAAAVGVAGETDAASFIEGVANGIQSIRQSITKAASALGYTGSVHVKNVSGTRKVVVQLDDGTDTNGVSMIVNPITGAVVSAPAAFGTGWSSLTAAMPLGYKIEAQGTYWRISLAATSDATTTIRLRVALWNGSTSSYAGDGTSGVYLWGAQVCNCNWPCSYISNRNLLTRSEDFSATWSRNRCTQTANSIANPLTGDVTATTITEDNTATNTHWAGQNYNAKPTSSQSVTISTNAKANGRTWIAVGASTAANSVTNSARAFFDLQNGVTGASVTAGAGFAVVSKAITSLGSGWYKCVVTITTDTSTNVATNLMLASADSTTTYSGDGVSGAYFYGTQMQYGTAATTYWATNSTGSGGRAAQLLLSTATLGTTQGTLLGLMIPYGWSGHYNNSTAYRIVSSQATATFGEIRGATGGASNSLTLGRTDGTPTSLTTTFTNSPGILDGTLIQTGMTWNGGGVVGFVNGIAEGSNTTTPVLPWATVTGTSVGPNSGSVQPNAYVLGLAFATALPPEAQSIIYRTVSVP